MLFLQDCFGIQLGVYKKGLQNAKIPASVEKSEIWNMKSLLVPLRGHNSVDRVYCYLKFQTSIRVKESFEPLVLRGGGEADGF